jgi:hypothetical protein
VRNHAGQRFDAERRQFRFVRFLAVNFRKQPRLGRDASFEYALSASSQRKLTEITRHYTTKMGHI